MPELPEVEACRRLWERVGKGKRILAIELVDPGVVRHRLSTRPTEQVDFQVSSLMGQSLVAMHRHGKRLAWRFSDGSAWLGHLGMTGQWVAGASPKSRMRVVFDDGESLAFEDSRRFGCIVARDGFDDRELRQGHGPDAFDALPEPTALKKCLVGKRAIKVALLDQAVLAGLGNIHAVEALWRAQIHPDQPTHSLDIAQVARLYEGIREQLIVAIAEADVDELVYLNAGGPNRFLVYARAGEPCVRCQQLITTWRQTGRSTYACLACQPLA